MSVAELNTSKLPAARSHRVYYPTEDRKPMAEMVEHREAMPYAIMIGNIALAHLPTELVNHGNV